VSLPGFFCQFVGLFCQCVGSLLPVYRSLLSVCWFFVSVCWFLLSVCRSLLSVCWSFCKCVGLFGPKLHDLWAMIRSPIITANLCFFQVFLSGCRFLLRCNNGIGGFNENLVNFRGTKLPCFE